MAKRETTEINLPSLLDRLIDLEPKVRKTTVAPAQSLRELKAALRRDLEWLLNTRRSPAEAPEAAEELRRSVFYYGIPDLSHLSLNSVEDQQRLTRIIENAIHAFEPRLERVNVSLQRVQKTNRILKFQIEGMLRMEPAPERVLFDTTLELASGQYDVEGEPGAR